MAGDQPWATGILSWQRSPLLTRSVCATSASPSLSSSSSCLASLAPSILMLVRLAQGSSTWGKHRKVYFAFCNIPVARARGARWSRSGNPL